MQERVDSTTPAHGLKAKFFAYLALTKPRVIELLLVTTLPVMILAERGWPSVWLMIATLIGGAGAAGSANALNCYIDRDIDVIMNRTKNRPLVTGAVTPTSALVFAALLGAASIAWLIVTVNPLSALLAFGAIAFYVIVYTMVLKRRTPQNIVWGGIAGCVPVLIGWSAVTNSLSWTPVVLFLVIFFWTPPHYWPLSMKFRDDYREAGVPMLPVVAADQRVAYEIVAYTVAMIVTTLVLIPVASMTWVYAAVAVASGAWFLFLTVRLALKAHRGERKLGAMSVFHASISYLTVLFIAIAVDPFLGGLVGTL